MTHFGLRNFRSAWSMLSADLTDLDLTVQESCPLLESAFPLLTRAEGSERSHLNGRRQNKILPIFTDFRKGNKIALVKSEITLTAIIFSIQVQNSSGECTPNSSTE